MMLQYSKVARQVAFLAAVTTALGLYATGALYADDKPAARVRTPVNEVFQFMAPDPNTKAKGYLWIPETCKRVRGLVVLCPNVPEQMISVHQAIRDASRRNDLGIVWGNPSFLDNGRGAGGGTVDVLKRVLTGLAAVSGYDEVATVPWIPMGESGHLEMVQQIVDAQPSRCIAAVCLKNPRWPKTDRTVPMLFALGTGYEFGQCKQDMALPVLPGEINEYDRACQHEPTWPLSVIVERHTGHFACTEPMAWAIARYIDGAAKARLSTDGSDNLRLVDMGNGFYADLPVPGHTKSAITPASTTPEAGRHKPWYFTQACAADAQSIASVDWATTMQLPSVKSGTNCVVKPWAFANGIMDVAISTSSEFSLDPILLDAVPAGFVNAGAKLPVGPNKPVVEWVSGDVWPLGNNRFRVTLDRNSWVRLAFLDVRVEESPGAGGRLEPISIGLVRNSQGTPQRITFNPMPDISSGTVSVPLVATSNSGLPVQFFVVAGPAIADNGRLVFTGIPPKAKFPISVTVGAWQWGSNTDPKFQQAETVFQTFEIVKGAVKARTFTPKSVGFGIEPPPAPFSPARLTPDVMCVQPGSLGGSPSTIDLSKASQPAPMAVYQGEEYGPDIEYIFWHLQPKTKHLVRLHFAENWFSQAGKRVFDVLINGQPVLQKFDIFAAAGGRNIAVVEEFHVAADAAGKIDIEATAKNPGGADNAKFDGIQVLADTAN